MTIAQTIISQIKSLDRNALMAWGAKDLVDTGNGLQFTSSGMVKWKGKVLISYNEATDLYDIKFFKIRKFEFITVKEVTDVFCEDLVQVIDEQVG